MDKRVANLRQICSVTRYELSDGAARGLRVIDCDNGKLRFMLCPTRALDIMQMWYKGENLSFISKNGFVAENRPFLERFEGGMLYTCGLDSVGGREGFELHGTHHITPATVTRAEATEDGITIEATVRASSLFGKNLVFKRRVFSAVGSESVRIEDTLINEGYKDEEYCLLYHVNLGYPLLDNGGKIVGDITKITSRTPYAEERIADALITEAPDLPEETCYYLDLESPKVSYVNERVGKSFTVRYSGEALGDFLLWKSMVAGDFALGLEPTTTRLDSSFAYKTVAPGERVSFTLELTATDIT